MPKSASLFLLLQQYGIDIMSINETWLKSIIANNSLFLPGYRIFRLDRETHGGGVAFLVHNKYNSHIENTILSPCIELMHISISLMASNAINVVTLYRPPSCNCSDFISYFTNFLNNIDYTQLPLTILGDFNINIYNDKCSVVKQFKACISDYGLLILNKSPTRTSLHSKSSTLIDLVIVNRHCQTFINSIQTSPCAFSDHNYIFFGYKKAKVTVEKKPLLQRYTLKTILTYLDLPFPVMTCLN